MMGTFYRVSVIAIRTNRVMMKFACTSGDPPCRDRQGTMNGYGHVCQIFLPIELNDAVCVAGGFLHMIDRQITLSTKLVQQREESQIVFNTCASRSMTQGSLPELIR